MAQTVDIDAEITKALTDAFGDKASQVQKLRDESSKVEYDAYAHKVKGLSGLMATRNELVKDVPEFWFNALVSSALNAYVDLQDHDALKAITDFEIKWEADPRAFTITISFADNKFFSDKQLSKSFKPAPDGTNLDKYSLNADLVSTSVPISWKSDAVNLVKNKPRPKMEEHEEFDDLEHLGSFFNWFGEEDDKLNLGDHLTDFYFSAHNIFAKIEGAADLDDVSMNSSDEEDEDDDAAEIDLEEEEARRAKKRSRRG